mmetsp:Transcript_16662/g.39888  ORF Transcript_16662/g.39888 Transcript_16662/m.39888 type:complete len:245 (-) Transcript_16662:274-1008(-)
MNMTSETTPLDSKKPPNPLHNAGGSAPTAYFLGGVHRRNSSIAEDQSYHTAAGEEVDDMPEGGVAAEFIPRQLGTPRPGVKNRKMRKPSIGGGWLDYMNDSWTRKTATGTSSGFDPATNAGEIGTLILPRKAPLKVEPKVHFGNERTFLAWLHVVTLLAAGSMTIVSYSKDESIVNQLYGIVLLPVSVAFLFYALLQYLRRAHLINNRQPGPYIDVAGPTTLTIIVMATIIVQFCMKLHVMIHE